MTTNLLKVLAAVVAAFFKAPEAVGHHYRTTQEEHDLRHELRMLGGA